MTDTIPGCRERTNCNILIFFNIVKGPCSGSLSSADQESYKSDDKTKNRPLRLNFSFHLGWIQPWQKGIQWIFCKMLTQQIFEHACRRWGGIYNRHISYKSCWQYRYGSCFRCCIYLQSLSNKVYKVVQCSFLGTPCLFRASIDTSVFALMELPCINKIISIYLYDW